MLTLRGGGGGGCDENSSNEGHGSDGDEASDCSDGTDLCEFDRHYFINSDGDVMERDGEQFCDGNSDSSSIASSAASSSSDSSSAKTEVTAASSSSDSSLVKTEATAGDGKHCAKEEETSERKRKRQKVEDVLTKDTNKSDAGQVSYGSDVMTLSYQTKMGAGETSINDREEKDRLSERKKDKDEGDKQPTDNKSDNKV